MRSSMVTTMESIRQENSLGDVARRASKMYRVCPHFCDPIFASLAFAIDIRNTPFAQPNDSST